jgi:ADP-ribosylation factor GTPase-activating protein 2/3
MLAFYYCILINNFICKLTRSISLDSWTWDQLRIMKVGGNQAFKEYVIHTAKRPELLNKDAKSRYDSDVARKYKKVIEARAKEDSLK